MPECQLVIRDEVNVKIEGLDADLRRRLTNHFKYEVPGARYLPAVRLGRWDGKVSYFSLAGATYINLLPDIIPMLEDAGYDIDIEDTRNYRTHYDLKSVTETSFSHRNWPEGHPQAGEPILLRDYQCDIINRFMSNPQSIQEVATGAGKTIMTAALSASVEAYGRSIVIVPNKSLVTQTERDYKNVGLDVGVFFGDRKEHGHQHTICTWQSLNVLLKNTRAGDTEITIGEFIEGVVCVIVDEVHMAKADALKTLLTGVMSHVPIRWGLTGTVPKEDYNRLALTCTLGPVTGQLSASELQDQGVLANCHVNIMQLVEHKEFNNYQTELKYLLENSERLDYIAKMIDQIRRGGNTLILIDRVGAGQALVSRIQDAVFLSGATKNSERQEEYDEVATATDKVLVCTYGIAAVGINVPRIFNLVLIEPGKSFVRVIQSIGRGIRRASDKDHVEIWDITSSCKFAKRHLTQRKNFYREAKYPFDLERVNYI
jgi:superfamily II DNA or RNA helicase